ncbi:hypothetical protein ACRAWF_33830 [Streptomyces sp. L7]
MWRTLVRAGLERWFRPARAEARRTRGRARGRARARARAAGSRAAIRRFHPQPDPPRLHPRTALEPPPQTPSPPELHRRLTMAVTLVYGVEAPSAHPRRLQDSTPRRRGT